ncbi:MAG: Monofunctional biosynthetic peptidoglycan transglycosylase [Gammaproteobacteria bacterium]|nr:Monofunctional biosynthetic peptidoglycan transglycosylase [Gammaproteobacteria bacterium]
MRRRTAAIALAALVAGALVAAPGRGAPWSQSFAQVRAAYRSSEARLLDRHGAIIHELRVDERGRRLEWTPLEAISPALIEAVVRAEDRRFREHHGVDWLGTAAALWSNVTGEGARRGASTITMQLAAQLDPALRPRDGKRTPGQKWAQMQRARGLERTWTKAQVLEAYLNLVTYRGELQGVAAASRGLLEKEPGGITRPEAALLAALIRAPNADAVLVARRACTLDAQMRARGDPAARCRRIEALARTVVGRAPHLRPSVALAPHVARLLLEAGSESVRSTIDAAVQRHAGEVLRHQLQQLTGRNVRDGAVLVVDNASGRVLAYVGNAGINAEAVYVDGVRAMRQAGSTLKPFLYGLAIDQRRMTAASLLQDSPVNLRTPTGLYVPQNYDREFRGWVSARTALASSLNVPAVRALMLVGVETFADQLRRLGFAGVTESGDYYGYSLALGSAEVSLWQLVNAYRTLANGGRYGAMSLQPDDGAARAPSREVMTAGAAFIVGDILADRGARAATFGLDNPVALQFPAAVKTGTTKDMRDNWCIGYSQRHTVGVWVGNFNGEAMHGVSGITGAAPVWAEVMRYLHQGRRLAAPAPPDSVVALRTEFQPRVEPPRQELYLRGTQMPLVALNAGAARAPRIAYPGDGTILALDPDIPADRQRVFFDMDPALSAATWRLDGAEVAAGEGWQPRSGVHALQLVDARGHVLDRVRFLVRGRAP